MQTDVASKIRVKVSYLDGGSTAETLISVVTEIIINTNDGPAGLPTISGIAKQGQILAASTQGISDADGLGAFSYQWLRDDGEISGATNSAYTLVQADVASKISVWVSYIDGGFTAESVLSETLGPVENINDLGVVTIIGEATEASILSVESIMDTDGASTSTFIYQWLRDGKVIDLNATVSTYKLVQADVGKKVTLRVVYTDDLGTGEVVISNEIGPVFSDVPVVTAPVLNPVNATGWFTFVDIGQAVAFDALDGPLTAISDSNGQFRPGETTVTWSATDLAGNVGTATQIIKVIPLVEISKDQKSAEGDRVDFNVILNGDALNYPVKVPYFVSGTADGHDHTLKSGEVRIEKPASGELPEKAVSFDINTNDGVEGLETIVISLGIPTNANAVLGPVTTHTVEIVEENVAPLVSINASQLGVGNMLQVDPEGGEVTVHAIATDANGDALAYDWSATDNALIDNDGDSENSSFTLNLQNSPVTPGFYTFHVLVSDGSVTVESTLVLNVLSETPVLSSLDSDNDGVVNHLDTVQASNVLQQKTAISDQLLMQTEAGLKLSLGEVAFKADQGRSMVTQAELTDYSFAGNASVDTVVNVGGYFDFTVSGLPVAGQSVQVVIPQLAQMSRSSVYRKLTLAGWQDFVKDENNSVASAAGEEGYCPPPGHSDYISGLRQGHWCLQLTIEDGGPNDSDGIANNSVTDPGGLGRVLTDVSVSSSGGGGAWHPLLPALNIFIILFFRYISYLQGNRDEYQVS